MDTVHSTWRNARKQAPQGYFDVTFAAANRTSSACVASLTEKHIGPFDQISISCGRSSELVEEPGRLVFLYEPLLWSQTEKVLFFFLFLVL